jgi:V-type H+-transporting ATPase subunit H
MQRNLTMKTWFINFKNFLIFKFKLEDILFLSERLHASIQDLSSFDEYCTEIRSGRLNWSPVHKSEKFWRENSQRFNEKNFELIKLVGQIIY